MKKIVSAVLAMYLFLSGAVAQSVINEPNAQVRTVGSFHSIRVATGIQLYISQGDEDKVVVSAKDVTYRDKIRTEVSGGELHIYYDTQIWKWKDIGRRELTAYVSCKVLDGLTGVSGARVDIDGTLKSSKLAMEFNSGARFKGKIEADMLSISQASGAKATISGTAAHFRADASSGAAMSGYDLEVDDCDVTASSGAHIDINVRKEMAARAHSGAHVNYSGAGVIKEVHTGSGGVVSRR